MNRDRVLLVLPFAVSVAVFGGLVASVGAAQAVSVGDLVQVPVHIPINLCANSIDIVGALSPAVGNTCINT